MMSHPESAIRWHKRHAVQRLSRLLDRIVKMSLPEIRQRLRLRVRGIPGLRQRFNREYQQQSEATAQSFVGAYRSGAVNKLRNDLNNNFIYGPAHKKRIVSAINRYGAQGDNQTIRLADAFLQGEFTLLGQPVKLVNSQIDWHADPKTGAKNWPLEFMDEHGAITMTDQDVKYVWEVNRHQFIPLLGRAYWLSDDPKYATAAKALILDWIDNNPAGLGVNWCSHLEVAMRAISWLWAMPFLLDSKVADEKFVQTWLGSLAQHYYHLSKNLSVFTDPTNHLIGETTALWLLASCFPELPGAEHEQQRCRTILLQHLDLQTHQDGVNREQASSYHRFVTDFYLQFLCVSRRQSKDLPERAEKLIEKMFEYCVALAGSHGTAPMIGDSDDARGIPMPEVFGWDFRDTVVSGAVLFERSDFVRDELPLPDAVVWLVSENSLNEYVKLEHNIGQAPSTVFDFGGMCFLNSRNGNSQLIFDIGNLGLWPNASHAHTDSLSIIVRVNGKLLIVDPGTGTYFESEQERNWFRGTSSHNTVTIDGLDQADIHGTFKWVNPYETTVDEKVIGDELCYVSASHNGYTRFKNPVTHRRSVLSVSSGGWIVIDEIQGTGVHSVERNFHFAPGVSCTPEKTGLFEVKDPESDAGLRIYMPLMDTDESHVPHISEDSRHSSQYGSSQQTLRLRQYWKGQLPQTMITIIEPIEGAAKGSVEPVYSTMQNDDTDSFAVLRSAANSEQVYLVNPNNNEIALPNKMRSDASFLYVEVLDETIQHAFIRGSESHFTAPGLTLSCDDQQSYKSYQHIAKGTAQELT